MYLHALKPLQLRGRWELSMNSTPNHFNKRTLILFQTDFILISTEIQSCRPPNSQTSYRPPFSKNHYPIIQCAPA